MSTRNTILSILKTSGALSSRELAERLKITPMAIKLQLYDLSSEGLVKSEIGPRSRGRPSKIWRLTEAADQYFPNAHAALSRDILVGIRRSLGEEALDTVLSARANEQQHRYIEELRNHTSIASKLVALAKLRSEEGYMATVEKINGQLVLVENHCPICSAAKECLKLCSSELDLFRKALGENVQVDRNEHIVSGDRRCSYTITMR